MNNKKNNAEFMASDRIKRLLVGTRNKGKVNELRGLFETLPIELVGLNEFSDIGDVEETGTTFLENAVLKARAYSKAVGIPAIADDSGLEVSALGGAPGVLSARYAGENTPFAEKISRLLEAVIATGTFDMSARFTCSMAVTDPSGKVLANAEGVCHGRLAEMPRGSGGFGYDPIFIPEGFDETFGELPDQIKQEISHRARASKKIIQYLLDFIEV